MKNNPTMEAKIAKFVADNNARYSTIAEDIQVQPLSYVECLQRIRENKSLILPIQRIRFINDAIDYLLKLDAECVRKQVAAHREARLNEFVARRKINKLLK